MSMESLLIWVAIVTVLPVAVILFWMGFSGKK